MPPRLLRHIACTTALLGLLLSAQGGLLAHALFQWQRAHIAEHHCENRFDPDSTCNGLCFLKKRMAEQHEHDEAQHATVAASNVVFFLPGASGDVPAASPAASLRYADTAEVRSDPGVSVPVDRPPAAA